MKQFNPCCSRGLAMLFWGLASAEWPHSEFSQLHGFMSAVRALLMKEHSIAAVLSWVAQIVHCHHVKGALLASFSAFYCSWCMAYSVCHTMRRYLWHMFTRQISFEIAERMLLRAGSAVNRRFAASLHECVPHLQQMLCGTVRAMSQSPASLAPKY